VLSAVSGLHLPAWLTALLVAVGIAGGIAFVRRELRTRHPLIPVWLLRSASVAFALIGAACGYLTLFGPLVLIPQLLGHGPGGEARTGLLLSALPVGFGVAALFGDAVLPKAWGDRRRGFAGATLTCAAMCAAIFLPVTQTTVVAELALAGLGLGIFIPANNTVIMRAAADSSASLLGGLVNMARGIGTTLGISLIALALHLGNLDKSGHGYAESAQARPAFILLAVASAVAAAIALASRAQGAGGAVQGGGSVSAHR
jgi:MFS family permease